MAPQGPDTAPFYAKGAVLRAQLNEAVRGWAAGALSQSQLLAACAELRARLENVERRIGQASQGSVLHGLADGTDVAAWWATLPLDRRRSILDVLAVVSVQPRRRLRRSTR